MQEEPTENTRAVLPAHDKFHNRSGSVAARRLAKLLLKCTLHGDGFFTSD